MTEISRTPLARGTALAAIILLTITTAFSSASVASTPAEECINDAEVPGCCSEVEETGNMWYNNDPVNCDFSCNVGAELFISVTSSDSKWGTPDVWGTADCGDAHAKCPKTPKTCAGNSVAPALSSGDGTCKGETNDLVGSDTTIVCVATVPELPECYLGDGNKVEQAKACGMAYTCNGWVPLVIAGQPYGPGICTIGDDNEIIQVCIYMIAMAPFCVDTSEVLSSRSEPPQFSPAGSPDAGTESVGAPANSGTALDEPATTCDAWAAFGSLVGVSLACMEFHGGEASGVTCGLSGCQSVEPKCNFVGLRGQHCYIAAS